MPVHAQTWVAAVLRADHIVSGIEHDGLAGECLWRRRKGRGAGGGCARRRRRRRGGGYARAGARAPVDSRASVSRLRGLSVCACFPCGQAWRGRLLLSGSSHARYSRGGVGRRSGRLRVVLRSLVWRRDHSAKDWLRTPARRRRTRLRLALWCLLVWLLLPVLRRGESLIRRHGGERGDLFVQSRVVSQ